MYPGTEGGIHSVERLLWPCFVRQLCIAIIYELSYFIFKNNLQNKQAAWQNSLKRNYELNLVLKVQNFKKMTYSLYDLLVCHIVIETLIVNKKAEAKKKKIVRWKLIFVIINNAPVISKMAVISSFNFSIALTVFHLCLNKYLNVRGVYLKIF